MSDVAPLSDLDPLSDLEEYDSEESDDEYTALPFPIVMILRLIKIANLGKNISCSNVCFIYILLPVDMLTYLLP